VNNQEYDNPPSDLDDTEPTQSGFLDSSSDNYSCPTLTPLFPSEKSAAPVVKIEPQSALLTPGLFLNLCRLNENIHSIYKFTAFLL